MFQKKEEKFSEMSKFQPKTQNAFLAQFFFLPAAVLIRQPLVLPDPEVKHLFQKVPAAPPRSGYLNGF